MHFWSLPLVSHTQSSTLVNRPARWLEGKKTCGQVGRGMRLPQMQHTLTLVFSELSSQVEKEGGGTARRKSPVT